MPNDRLPQHKKRLATNSQGEQNVPAPAARPAPGATNAGDNSPRQKRNTTPAGASEEEISGEAVNGEEKNEK